MRIDKEETALSLMECLKRLYHTLHKNVFRSFVQDLKPSPLFVLIKLLHASNSGTPGIRVSEIAASMGISVSGITQIITALEKDGYIRREMDPEDRRGVLVYLTEEGKTIMEPASHRLEESFLHLIEHLGEENSRMLVKILHDVEQYFDE